MQDSEENDDMLRAEVLAIEASMQTALHKAIRERMSGTNVYKRALDDLAAGGLPYKGVTLEDLPLQEDLKKSRLEEILLPQQTSYRNAMQGTFVENPFYSALSSIGALLARIEGLCTEGRDVNISTRSILCAIQTAIDSTYTDLDMRMHSMSDTDQCTTLQ